MKRIFWLGIAVVMMISVFSCSNDDNGKGSKNKNDFICTNETGTLKDINGNVYRTVKIGNQWWMAENLKVTHYKNGDPISMITDHSKWANLSSGGFSSYELDNDYIATFGWLYNWYAIKDSRGIAPEGWHIPTDNEWKKLEMFLGMSQAQVDSNGFRGNDEGNKIKESGTQYWNTENNNATNESCFTALPGGELFPGNFPYNSIYAFFWTASEYEENKNEAWQRTLYVNDSRISRSTANKHHGFSIRCVKD